MPTIYPNFDCVVLVVHRGARLASETKAADRQAKIDKILAVTTGHLTSDQLTALAKAGAVIQPAKVSLTGDMDLGVPHGSIEMLKAAGFEKNIVSQMPAGAGHQWKEQFWQMPEGKRR